jgi:hypothetical protein
MPILAGPHHRQSGPVKIVTTASAARSRKSVFSNTAFKKQPYESLVVSFLGAFKETIIF